MRGKNQLLNVGLVLSSLLMGAPMALADAIDGQWCSPSGRRIAIDGPAGVAPKGTRFTGQYSRHGFDFTMPNGEEDAGSPVYMQLQGERRVRVHIGLNEQQTWQRCPPDIS